LTVLVAIGIIKNYIMKKIILIATMALGFMMMSGAFIEANAQKQTVTVEHKKGWSHRKKYGVIGAGAGAATGALISKHHARGAVIGGVVGGASGYLLGRHKDRKYPYRRTYKTKKRVH
jgi:YmgG-like glycine-zipper protein